MTDLIPIGALLLGAVAVWLVVRGRVAPRRRHPPIRRDRRRGKDKLPRNPAASSTPYHAVTIRHAGAGACAAVLRVAGRIYLPNAAPQLPLKGCTSTKCRCQYVHQDDRRQEDRRQHHHMTE